MRHGEWITVHPVPGSFTILVGAFLEIASNGRCKSAVHRTTVDDRAARISVGSGLSPPPENVKITPAPKLVENAKSGAKFRSVTCQEFIQLFQSNSTDKSELDLIRM
ncbi:Gibberellin 3-beta-dioxygenase 1 [Apostasia shenzhenica]|uniref:Gibberellin 3-beta-dioxygenase 1 n=1 Tax=Apostasia shenzhenica TaxID=1088818 RepID=A0A2I0AIP3_9ASPA|nr:Gibberellin 3-beta-dioxygenase 1 [Apostasia shenzhenica]